MGGRAAAVIAKHSGSYRNKTIAVSTSLTLTASHVSNVPSHRFIQLSLAIHDGKDIRRFWCSGLLFRKITNYCFQNWANQQNRSVVESALSVFNWHLFTNFGPYPYQIGDKSLLLRNIVLIWTNSWKNSGKFNFRNYFKLVHNKVDFQTLWKNANFLQLQFCWIWKDRHFIDLKKLSS